MYVILPFIHAFKYDFEQFTSIILASRFLCLFIITSISLARLSDFMLIFWYYSLFSMTESVNILIKELSSVFMLIKLAENN